MLTKRRFNIWLDIDVIKQVAKAAKLIGVKSSSYMRMAILEQLRRHQDGSSPDHPPLR